MENYDYYYDYLVYMIGMGVNDGSSLNCTEEDPDCKANVVSEEDHMWDLTDWSRNYIHF